MQLTFQKKIAYSSFTLPVVCALSIVLWLLLPLSNSTPSLYSPADTGLWQLIPQSVLHGMDGWCLALALAGLCVYLSAELNNHFALLRISSRLISSTLAFLFSLFVCVHSPQPGMLLAIFTLLSFFTLFKAYQQPSPALTFSTFLSLSLASLVFPKFLIVVPLYWALHIQLSSFSFRCYVSSLLAIVMPYWLLFGFTFSKDTWGLFYRVVEPLASWQMPDYATEPTLHIVQFAFAVLVFAIGVIDFFHNSFLDKSGIRSLFHAVTIHGLYIIACICLLPQYFTLLLPVLLVDAAIVFGHFFALTYTRTSHIISLIMLVLAILIVYVGF